MRVNFSPAAEDDLAEIEEYLALRFSESNARRFIQRITLECQSLAKAPRRGTVRDDVGPGIRIVGFERRVSIIFELKVDQVTILGVYYRGRQLDETR